jgi:hypothetical protein
MIKEERTAESGLPIYNSILQGIRDLIRMRQEAMNHLPLSDEEVETELNSRLVLAVPHPPYSGKRGGQLTKGDRKEFRLRNILKYGLRITADDTEFLERRKQQVPAMDIEVTQAKLRREAWPAGPLPTREEVAMLIGKERKDAKRLLREANQGKAPGKRHMKKLYNRLNAAKNSRGPAAATGSNSAPLGAENEHPGQTRLSHAFSRRDAVVEAQTGTHNMLVLSSADVEMDADEQEDDKHFIPPDAHARPTMASPMQLRSAGQKQENPQDETKQGEWKMELQIRTGLNNLKMT